MYLEFSHLSSGTDFLVTRSDGWEGVDGEVRSGSRGSLFSFIYSWLGGVSFAAQTFSSCGEQGLSSIAVLGLLIVLASLVAGLGL